MAFLPSTPPLKGQSAPREPQAETIPLVPIAPDYDPVVPKPVPPQTVTRHAVEEGIGYREAPAFVEVEDGRFEAAARAYRAELSAGDGLRYRSLREGLGKGPHEIHISLATVTRGDESIFNRGEDPEADAEIGVADDAGGLSFWRAPGFEEHYKPRGDGVEQSFVLESAPPGNGDLELVSALGLTGLTPLPARATRNGGISFVDSAGQIAARYGQVVIRDSARRGLVLEPKLSADARSISFSVPGQWLDDASYPVVIDPLVGGDFLISSDNTVGVGPPTVIAGNNSFLVVWNSYADGPTLPQLFACIVSASGIPSTEFPISAAVGLPRDFRFQRIEGAFDGANWLVAWSDDRLVGPGIRASIISSNGSILGGNDFLIATTSGTIVEDPLVSYNGIDFLVAWQSLPPGASGGSQVYYSRVTTAGVVDTPQVVPTEVLPVNQALLFLSSQRPTGDTLLIYRENSDDPPQTRSVRIAIDGSIRDPGGTTLFNELVELGGFGRPIGATFVGPDWHILSSFDQNIDSSIYLHKLSTSGVITPPAGVFAEFGLTPIGIAAESHAPAFAGAGEWLFVRNEKINATVYHQIGKRVTFDGVDRDPVPFQIDTATQGILRHAVAAQSGSVYLVAWLDGRRSTTQPDDSRNIVGAIVDSTIAGDTSTPLVAAISASPVAGEAPLSVMFDASASTGSFDTRTWNFGDGTSSTEATISHTYKNNGTYLAQLTLTKGAYTVYDTVVITVGTGGGIGSGGGTQVGSPVENSPGMVTDLFISNVVVRLDFATEKKDVARVAGIIDAGKLPDSLTGLLGSVSFGGTTSSFSLDASGSFKSDPNFSPISRFNINAKSGEFVFEIVNADLRVTLDALGAKNETVKPAVIVNIPITLTLDKFAATATVGSSYKATIDVVGTANYGFLGTGNEVSGSFMITKFDSGQQKQPKTGVQVHTFSIKGRVIQPDGGKYKAGLTGQLSFTIGTYTASIPVGQFREIRGKLKYVGRTGISGLKKFTIDFNSGEFNLQFLKVPAEGVGGSGMPLANSGGNITKVDLNLSFQFDLADNERFTAGRYILISRKDASGKVWKLR